MASENRLLARWQENWRETCLRELSNVEDELARREQQRPRTPFLKRQYIMRTSVPILERSDPPQPLRTGTVRSCCAPCSRRLSLP